MREALLLVSILAISVVTTACINSFAVQELNNKAMTFMEQGNYPEAIERLKSSIDLDDSIFESHYNLAVAYTKSEDYVNALNAYKKAIALKPDFADSYYSLAVAEENIASDLNAGAIKLDENGNLQKVKSDSDNEEVKAPKLTEAETAYVDELLKDSISNYNEYLEKSPQAKDFEDVQNHVKELELKLNPAQE